MEQQQLLQEARRLIDAASEAEGKGEPEIAKTNIKSLQLLLTDELSVPAPAEPEKPTPDGVA